MVSPQIPLPSVFSESVSPSTKPNPSLDLQAFCFHVGFIFPFWTTLNCPGTFSDSPVLVVPPCPQLFSASRPIAPVFLHTDFSTPLFAWPHRSLSFCFLLHESPPGFVEQQLPPFVLGRQACPPLTPTLTVLKRVSLRRIGT